MRIPLQLLIWGIAGVLALPAAPDAEPQSTAPEIDPASLPVPATLEAAHARLEELLSKDELRRIDSMASEQRTIVYHFTLGTWIRHNWLTDSASPLLLHLQRLGFTSYEDMSGILLETLWCKRHKKPFQLEKRVAYFAQYWKAVESPPATTVDPRDRSSIEWKGSLRLDSRQPFRYDGAPRYLHVGQSRTTRRWVVYEHDRGAFLPDAKTLARIRREFRQR